MVLLSAPHRPEGPLRFLLFDLDGTLVDTAADIAGAVNHALAALGIPARSTGEIRSFVGQGVEQLMRRSLGREREDRIEEGLDRFREHYDLHCLDNSRLLPGASACLEKFAGRELGVVSNKPERYVRRILDELGIGDSFSAVFGGDSVEEKKPSPLMIRNALERFRLSPEEGIFIGDHMIDVETGRAARVFTVAVLGGFASREQLEGSNPDLIAESLVEVARSFD